MGVLAAGLAGLALGGLGAGLAAKSASNAQREAAQAASQQQLLFQQAQAKMQADKTAMQDAMARDAMVSANNAAAANATIGSEVSTRLRKFGGLSTVATSLFGDTSTPYLGSGKLLGN